MEKEYNTKTYIKIVEKNGKKYKNLVNETKLASGEVVRYEINLRFYNNKFAYKLEKGLEYRKQ